MFFKHPVYLLLTLIALILLHLSLDQGRTLRKGIKGYLFIAIIIFITNPLFSSRGATILGYVMDRPITLESIVYGGLFALSLLNILFAFAAYQIVITPDKLLFLLNPLLPRTAFLITVTMRFVPLLTRRLKDIMTVKHAMGGRAAVSRRERMKDSMETLHTLITWSLEEALETASSMRARGYGLGKRSSAVRYKMDGRDQALLWVLIITGMNISVGGVLGTNEYQVYPSLPALLWTPTLWLHLACYVVFLCVPLVLNGKEHLYWHYTRSKM